MAFIKVGNKVLKFGGKVVTNDPNPLKLPPFTIRCKFSSGYTPTMGDSQTLVDETENVWDITKNSTDWSFLFDGTKDDPGFPYLLKVLGANSSGVTDMNTMFRNCNQMDQVARFDTSSVTSTLNMFNRCSKLTTIPQYCLESATDVRQIFMACTRLRWLPPIIVPAATSLYNLCSDCSSLTEIHLITSSALTDVRGAFQKCTSLITASISNTSHVTTFTNMCVDCQSLVTIPTIDTNSATNVKAMLKNCVNVQAGILDFYRQLSTQTSPPSAHSDTFTNCGTNGLAADELAQIPTEWGGTMST